MAYSDIGHARVKDVTMMVLHNMELHTECLAGAIMPGGNINKASLVDEDIQDAFIRTVQNVELLRQLDSTEK